MSIGIDDFDLTNGVAPVSYLSSPKPLPRESRSHFLRTHELREIAESGNVKFVYPKSIEVIDGTSDKRRLGTIFNSADCAVLLHDKKNNKAAVANIRFDDLEFYPSYKHDSQGNIYFRTRKNTTKKHWIFWKEKIQEITSQLLWLWKTWRSYI